MLRFELHSVSRETGGLPQIGRSTSRSQLGALLAPGDSMVAREGGYWERLFSAMNSEDEIRFHHVGWRETTGQIRYRCLIEGRTSAPTAEQALKAARHLAINLNVSLAEGSPDYVFTPLQAADTSVPSLELTKMMPLGVEVSLGTRTTAGYVRSTETADSSVCLLPAPVETPARHLDSVLAAARVSTTPVDICLAARSVTLTDCEMRAASEAAAIFMREDLEKVTLEGGPHSRGKLSEAMIESLALSLQRWLHTPRGYQISCTVAAKRPIPDALLEAIGHNLYPGRTVHFSKPRTGPVPSVPPQDASLDLRQAHHAMEATIPLLPAVESLLEIGTRRHYRNPPLTLPPWGIVVGDASIDGYPREVRIAPTDRSRHAYVLGATGSGKSTLLYNMIMQDIENGAGVGLIDPHGDLFNEVLGSIPEQRIADVVVMDLSDTDHAVGLNFLECNGSNIPFQRGFVINELLKIFHRLYRDIPESMGPMFEQYMRNSLALLMGDPRGDATLAEVSRVFEEPAYRTYLKRTCQDPLIKAFWDRLAESVRGDGSITEVAPYITCKFNRFLYNPSIRAIIAQPRSTIDFGRVMNDGQILLVNLSKGTLGEADTDFLGMLVMGKLLGAAMGRAILPPKDRRQFLLYVDEFQNFTTDTVASMLSEARKYGLGLTLANQNMGQLGTPLQEVVMANVGTKIFFRMGTHDASNVEPYVAPPLTSEDMLTLPDYTAVGRFLASNTPLPPVVFQTRPGFTSHDATGTTKSQLDRVKEQCRRRYARPVRDVELAIAARRASLAT